ncbi:MAG TPA: DUF4403 family protein [Chitinophagaceae bacterium]|nr:DUF4403 family protein [Chitinophagaceae bacterium]
MASRKAVYNTLPPATVLPALPESNINVAVKVATGPFLAKAAVLVPKEVTSDGWPEYLQTSCDFHYKYRFVPGGFTFNCVNNQVMVKLSGTYQVSGEKCVCAFGKQTSPWIGGSCGFGKEQMRKTDIFIQSVLQFQPNYTVHTKTQAQKATALEKCTVSMFNLDITQQIMDSIKSSTNAFCYSMDSVVNGLDFSSTTKALAERINKKIPLDKYGYIKINPSAVRIGKMNSVKDTLQATLGIYCFPELHSDSTNNYSAAFLPPLQTADVQPGIKVYTNARYDYPFINSIINQMVRDTSFEVEGRKVVIKNVQLNGAENGKVEIMVDFEGDKKGSLYLVGTPQLDTASQVIIIPDLDYSLKSRDLVLNIGKAFFSNKILRTLREKATISIADIINQHRKEIDAQLNKQVMEGVFSTGALTDVRVLSLVVGKDVLQAQTCTRASASIIINSL